MDKDEILFNGMIAKGAQVKELSVSDDEMTKINKHTLSPLTAEEVYVFKLVVCDNLIDRQHERFTEKAISEMTELFIGKPIIKDHERRADNQIGRIYDTEVMTSNKEASVDGSPYTALVAHCYVLKTDTNKDLIAEIKGGIKKEVSVNMRMKSATCSICKKDNATEMCEHWWGREYDGQKCHFILSEPEDAFEVSFVAVPAQAKAGTMKEYSEKKKELPVDEPEADTSQEELGLKVKAVDAFIYIQNEKNKEE